MRIEATDSAGDSRHRHRHRDSHIGPSKGRLNRRKRASLAASVCKFLEMMSWIGFAAVPVVLALHWIEHPFTPPLPPGMTVDVIQEQYRGESYVDLERYIGWDPEPYVAQDDHESIHYVYHGRAQVHLRVQDAPVVTTVSFLRSAVGALLWALFFRQMGRFLRSVAGRNAFPEVATNALRRAARLLLILAPITTLLPMAILHFGSEPLTSLLRANGHRVYGVAFPRSLHPGHVPELFALMVLCAGFLALLARLFREGEAFEQTAREVV